MASGMVPGGPMTVAAPGVPGAPGMPGQAGMRPGMPAPMGGANPPSVPKVDLARARIKREAENPDDRIQAYKAFLELLKSTGVLKRLPTDPQGRLRVGAPFCHDFFDAPYLIPFLVDNCLYPNGNAQSMYVFGADLHAQHTWWAAWKEWFEAEYEGRVTSYFAPGDLAANCLPPSDLIVGIHPEPTHGGNWPTIIRNMIQSRSERGVIAFATFYHHEAEELVKMCQACGVEPQVLENPFHEGKEENAMSTFLRWLVLIQ